jgi:hypothetical protein
MSRTEILHRHIRGSGSRLYSSQEQNQTTRTSILFVLSLFVLTFARSRTVQFLVSRSDRLYQLTRIVECLDLPAVPAEWDQEIDTMESPSGPSVSTDFPCVLHGMETLPQTPGRGYRVIDPVPDGDHPQRTLSEAQIRLLDQYCTSIARTRTLRSHVSNLPRIHFSGAYATRSCSYRKSTMI